jgi:hypothetical protein
VTGLEGDEVVSGRSDGRYSGGVNGGVEERSASSKSREKKVTNEVGENDRILADPDGAVDLALSVERMCQYEVE